MWNSNLGYTSFEECTKFGYYNFLTADITSITDAPSDLSKGGVVYVYPTFAGTIAKFIRDLTGNEWFMYKGSKWVNTSARLTSLEATVSDLEYLAVPKIKWCAMGDSISQGYYSYLDEDGSVKYTLNPSIGWVNKVAKMSRYELTNKSVGGSGYICKRSEADPVLNAKEVANTIDFANFDLVTLAFGVNDWKYNCVRESMCDNMRYVIEKIMTDNPLCKIVVITPMNCRVKGDRDTNWGLGYSFSNSGTLEDIFNAIIEVCDYYGIEYVDMTHKSIINRYNIESMLLDEVHPSEECHTVLARELMRKITFY